MTQGALFGAPPPPRRILEDHRCAICGSSAGLGFASPREFMPRQAEWFCGEHAVEGEARWRALYGVAK